MNEITKTILGFISFIGVWILGCFIADKFGAEWPTQLVMGAGGICYILADFIDKKITGEK